jgi:hypothetical protein
VTVDNRMKFRDRKRAIIRESVMKAAVRQLSRNFDAFVNYWKWQHLCEPPKHSFLYQGVVS